MKSNSLIFRIFSVYIITIIIPFLAIEVLMYRQWVNTEIDNSITNSKIVLNELNNTMDTQVLSILEFFNLIYLDSNTEDTLLLANNHELTPLESLNITRKFIDISSDALGQGLGYQSLAYFDLSGQAIVGNQFYPLDINQGNENWFHNVIELDGQTYIEWSYKQNYATEQLRNTLIISFNKLLYTNDGLKPLGVLQLNYSPTPFFNIFRYISYDQNYRTMVLDNNKHLIFDSLGEYRKDSTERSVLNNHFLSEIIKNEELTFVRIKDNTETWICIYGPKAVYGYQIISLVPVNVVSAAATTYNKTFNILSILILLICAIITMLFMRAELSPIKKISLAMLNAEKNNYQDRIVTKRKTYEIQQLAKSFNEMNEQIVDSLEREKQNIADLARLELKVIESQINPHFLGNTFELLRWKAVASNNMELAEHIYLLSLYYKSVLQSIDRATTIPEEFENLKNYLRLIQFSDNSEIFMHLSFDKSLSHFSVKNILQPFVENAVLHGLKNKSGRKCIIVTAKITAKKQIQFLISDNGKGFARKYNLRINEQNKEVIDQLSELGTGIKSSLRRLEIYYSNNWEVLLLSKPNLGTTVQILINQIRNEGDDCFGSL